MFTGLRNPSVWFTINLVLLVTCSSGQQKTANPRLIDTSGTTISSRFHPPDSFERPKWPAGSFAGYLSDFPLLPNGSKVHLYNGKLKTNQSVAAAILDIDVGTKDLQQCADAVMRLRAEYLYKFKKYGQIQFHFTNGFLADYTKWANGYRIKVHGNQASWYPAASKDYGRATFGNYLETVFSYAGSLSLSKELRSKTIDSMMPGDILIIGGSPGHALTVMDIAIHKRTKKRLFLLAQSYMPAQSIHLLVNPGNTDISPWYEIPEGDEIVTPEWVFTKKDLKYFQAVGD